MKCRFLLAVSLCAISTAAAQTPVPDTDEKKDEKWDVAAPPMPMRDLRISVSEGTWMNLDVSPDGRMIAFDLLGDIYTMPISGGSAMRIAEGLPFEMQPTFSPDGQKIAFTSDRAGGDNIWVMNVDGSDKRQVTKETFRLLNAPTWSPDGTYIVARKHFTTARSLGTGELWMYHLGGGNGVQLVKRASDQLQKELGEPAFSPDGAEVYYTRNVSSGPIFEYAQDTNGEIFAIEKYDLASGEVTRVVGGAGGAVRPTPSPDGKWLAFLKRERGVSKLFLKDLTSGAVRKLWDGVDQDLQETWAVHGVYPSMEWIPNSKELVVWGGGKIWRIGLDGAAQQIPFTVDVTIPVIDPPRPSVEVAPDQVATRMPRFAVVSPKGDTVVFETLGKLYTMPTRGGAPRRLTRSGAGVRELQPSWSRDGRQLTFVEWTDEALGAVRTISAAGGSARTLTPTPGHYFNPVFSPDGRTIVYEKQGGGFLRSTLWSDDQGIFSVASQGGTPTLVTRSGGDPQFGAENSRVFLTRRDGGNFKFVSINFNGEDERTHLTSELSYEFDVAPDGRHVAFRDNYAAYVMPMMPGPQSVSTGKDGNAVPVVKASAGGATYFSWTGKGDRLFWSLGPTLFSGDIADMVPTTPKAKDVDSLKTYAPPTDGVPLTLTVPADKPRGMVALMGARVVTMAAEDGGIIDNATILIEDNRIVRVAPAADVSIPAGAKRIDVSGKTIIPGLIDAHAHGPYADEGIIPNQNWSTIGHLALGVTTTFDPSSGTDSFVAAELQRTGDILAPRIYTTGEIVYGAKSPTRFADIQTYDDAKAHVHRLKVQGAHGIKNYNQPRRDQRQQVVKAAIDENILVVPEGGSLFSMDISLVMDGNSSVEHNIPQRVLYEDVLSLYAQTNVAYVPTLVVTYGGLAGDPYWRYATDVWTHPILSVHVPPHILQPGSVRRTKAPETDFADQYAAREAKKLADRGVEVTIGAHGQQQGLAAHWEMWSFARGGMSPVEALRTATTAPAKHLGFDGDIGSIEAGKLADLVILDADPTVDIRNSDKVAMVMQNGRLFDAATMNEVITGNRQRPPYYWQAADGSALPSVATGHTAHQD